MSSCRESSGCPRSTLFLLSSLPVPGPVNQSINQSISSLFKHLYSKYFKVKQYFDRLDLQKYHIYPFIFMTSEEHFSSLNYLNFKVLLTLEINHLLQRTNVISKLFYGHTVMQLRAETSTWKLSMVVRSRMQECRARKHWFMLQTCNSITTLIFTLH